MVRQIESSGGGGVQLPRTRVGMLWVKEARGRIGCRGSERSTVGDQVFVSLRTDSQRA